MMYDHAKGLKRSAAPRNRIELGTSGTPYRHPARRQRRPSLDVTGPFQGLRRPRPESDCAGSPISPSLFQDIGSCLFIVVLLRLGAAHANRITRRRAMLGDRRRYLPRNHEEEQPGIRWGNRANSAPGYPDVSSQKTANDGGKRCRRLSPTSAWHLSIKLVRRAFRDCERIAALPDAIDMSEKRCNRICEVRLHISGNATNSLLKNSFGSSF